MDKQTSNETRSESKSQAGATTGAFPFPGFSFGAPGSHEARELIDAWQAEASRAFGAWEKMASEMAEKAARDPRALALGAAMLRSQLLAGKAMGLMWEAALAPIDAMVQAQERA